MQLTNMLDAVREVQGSILLLPFEDQDLVRQIRDAFPDRTIEQIYKSDISGKTTGAVLRMLRGKRTSVVIGSLHGALVHRSALALELLLTVVPARRRFVRTEEDTCIEISLTRVACIQVPRLAAGFVVGVVAAFTLTIVLLSTRRVFRRKPAGIAAPVAGRTVLFVRSDLPGTLKAGGSVSHVQGILAAFIRQGWTVHFLADAVMRECDPRIVQHVVRPLDLLSPLDDLRLVSYNIQLFAHILRLSRRHQVSLIYQRHAIFSIAPVLAARLLGIPLVLEVNGSEVWVKSHWSRLSFMRLARRCEAYAIRSADRLALVSDVIAEQIAPYGPEAARMLITPNGVDPEVFRPDIEGEPVREKYRLGRSIVVGFIGTFTRWHGVGTLLDAARHVVTGHRGITFLLIGDGDLRSMLEHRVADERLSDRIVFTGMVGHHAAPRFLAACDILVSPHLGFEGKGRFFGSPTKLFEYMAMGRAIIASNLEQIGDVIRDGENGLHMQPGDSAGLAAQIVRLATDTELRRTLGDNARRDAIRFHTWDRNVTQILASIERPIAPTTIADHTDERFS